MSNMNDGEGTSYAHRTIRSKSGNIAWRAATCGLVETSSTESTAVGCIGVGSGAGGESAKGCRAWHQHGLWSPLSVKTLTSRNLCGSVQLSLSHS